AADELDGFGGLVSGGICRDGEAASARVDSSSVIAMSTLLLKTRDRSFSKHRRNNVTTSRGVSAGICDQSGSPFNTSATRSLVVWPRNGFWPARHSNIQQPNAQMSVRLSTACPRACSGLM